MANKIVHSYQQIRELIRARAALSRGGISESNAAVAALGGAYGSLVASLGLSSPRLSTSLSLSPGFSPGTIRLWHDIESGWFTEYRASEKSPPIYHQVTDEEAVAILKGEVTPELAAKLEKPDEYVGE